VKNVYTTFSTRHTSQSQPIPGRETEMARNNAGGYAFPVDDWVRLDRFLILGSEGGTYYVREQTLTQRNAQAVIRCIKTDGTRVVNRVLEISEAGRAPKNDPALFVLAMCSALGDKETRKFAFEVLPRVARIGTHLFHFLEYRKQFGRWNRMTREGVARWYNDKDPDRLAYQVVKYRQRDGWTHRDVLRLCHAKPIDHEHDVLYHWVVNPDDTITHNQLPKLVEGFRLAQACEDEHQAIVLITDYNLTREMIPTQFLNSPKVWEALLERMPMTAMIRNLGKMSEVGLVTPLSDAARVITDRLRNQEIIRKARVHPLTVLVALRTYQQGHGFRGKLKWESVAQVVDALDDAFYLAFDNVESTGKRIMLALDISGSMDFSVINNLNLTAREAAAAMALVTARVEPYHFFTAFSDGIIPLTISPRQRLDDVVKYLRRFPLSGTDCALPMLYASKKKLEIDAFLIYTDSETWAGYIHPVQALANYRARFNPEAKLCVIGMTSTGFSIADPNDAGQMDVVGFDTATPQVISDFVK